MKPAVGAPTAHTNRRRAIAAIGAFAAAGALPLRAQGSFPDRAITLIVPFAPGGIADLTARAVAEHMASTLGQAVVVDNRPGAGSIVAATAVLGAKADGHTLLLMSNANAVSVGLMKKLPYDPVRDFAPVSLLGSFDLGLFVPANSRFADLRALLAHAKANPGKLNIGTISIGSTQHLAAKLFETVAGIDGLVVPYKGSPAVLTALRSGELDLAFEIVGPMLPHVAAGAVKALAVTAARRNPLLPEVPTVQQAGVASYDVTSWNALAVPAATPQAVIERLNRAAREATGAVAVKERLTKLGVSVGASSPQEQAALLQSEIKRWGDVIRRAKIEPE
jgi:tripartite-type tricarboxylate transporter receptor subunit TctC